MPYYRQVGEIPRKRHTQFRRPDGGLYAEELMGLEGFSHDSALLYHRDLPTAIIVGGDVRTARDRRRSVPNQPLLPRHSLSHTRRLRAGHRRRHRVDGCCSATATCA